MKRIRVLIVDDSAVVRQVLTQVLSQDPQIEVLGAVSDPLFATERMKLRWPDVILLDVEMPRMDGVTFLRKLMSERPTPVVICSSLTESSAGITMEALAAGAVTIVTKPKMGVKGFLLAAAAELLSAVKAASTANVRKLSGPVRPAAVALPAGEVAPKLSADAILSAAAPNRPMETTERIVAIGTSTGGTQALEAVLTALPKACPGIVIAQHMPEQFTAAFAARLDSLSQISIREAKNGERLLPGHALIAPGGKHLLLQRSGAYYYAEVLDGPLVNRHKPSVDVLFRSVARSAGRNALGIIMTGMGDDGARGLREMYDAGAYTVAQDEKSCVVFGMPKEAIALGGATEIAPLARMPEIILGARQSARAAAASSHHG